MFENQENSKELNEVLMLQNNRLAKHKLKLTYNLDSIGNSSNNYILKRTITRFKSNNSNNISNANLLDNLSTQDNNEPLIYKDNKACTLIRQDIIDKNDLESPQSRINNYYFIRDYSRSNIKNNSDTKDKKNKSKYFIIFVACICISILVFFLFQLYKNSMNLELTLKNNSIKSFIAGFIIGGFIFYIIKILISSKQLYTDVGKATPTLYTMVGQENKLVNTILEINPSFSYQSFISELDMKLKNIIYTENPKDLEFYIGKNEPNFNHKTIIDYIYKGNALVKDFINEDDCIYATFHVFIEGLTTDIDNYNTTTNINTTDYKLEIKLKYEPINAHINIISVKDI